MTQEQDKPAWGAEPIVWPRNRRAPSPARAGTSSPPAPSKAPSAAFADVYIEAHRPVPGQTHNAQACVIPKPAEDGKRQLFLQMRHLNRYRWRHLYPSDQLQAVTFYHQARFMERFEDDYAEHVPFSMYYPDYQAMSYAQLRTYFTWRSQVRRGDIQQTSLSYVFVYIYELINNIGVADCCEGLDRLLSIWREYRVYERKLDKYMFEWIPDYYITNDFSLPFAELLQKDPFLSSLYAPSAAEGPFAFYAALSDYKLEKSIFYSAETEPWIRACFNRVVQALTDWLAPYGTQFDDLIFYSQTGRWRPFHNALYYVNKDVEPPRTAVQLSNTDRYWYDGGYWYASKNRVHRENGRRIIGYILKRIEQFYRSATKYKYRLTASKARIDLAELARLVPEADCGAFFARIDAAIAGYYRDSQRIHITVDPLHLEEIRLHARITQEKLLVNPEDEPVASAPPPPPPAPVPQAAPTTVSTDDPWTHWAGLLSPAEHEAVRLALCAAPPEQLHALSQRYGTMLEVLVDGINEKALDTVSDNVMELSDTLTVFDEYKPELKRVIFLESD